MKQRGVSIDVIPQEIAPIGDFIKTLSEPLGEIISDGDFATPQARERAIRDTFMSSVQERAAAMSLKQIWLRDEKPVGLNVQGKWSLLAVPIDRSDVVDMNNGTVGTLLSVYRGDSYSAENLVATFIMLYGPTTALIARVVSGEEAQVYDFIWSEEAHKFVPRQRGGKETSLIETGHKGDELAIYGAAEDWPGFLRSFYENEIVRRGKKVRISETVADLYEMLLKGGVIAAPLTDAEIVMWASVMDAAGLRAYSRSESIRRQF